MFPVGASTLEDPRPQLGEIEYGEYIMDCKVPGTVAMTFDDGPNVYTGELLDKLKVAGAKATFMISANNNGRQIDQGDIWSELLKRMIDEGHQVASHTWSHPHMDAITSEDRKMEMAKTERAIANIIGKYPTYMRPPYSQCESKSGCQKDMKDMGYSIGRTLVAASKNLISSSRSTLMSWVLRVTQSFASMTFSPPRCKT
jgi:peptidoglycan/xylan/chitin deacetylase (PgdA/CDA1 family)